MSPVNPPPRAQPATARPNPATQQPPLTRSGIGPMSMPPNKGGGAPTARPATNRPNLLSLNISSKSALYVAYIAQFKNGGIFIPTDRDYTVGEEVFMLLSLLDDPTKYPVAGKVAWMTPPGAQNNRPPGVGIHFNSDENSKAVRRKIEVILTGTIGATRPTNTL